MTEALVQRRHTKEDLERLEDPERFELIDGDLVELDMGTTSNAIAARILGRLSVFVEDASLGHVMAGETTLAIFGAEMLPRADGVYISMTTLDGRQLPQGHLDIVPDLVLEVVSGRDIASRVNTKVERYIQAGIRLVWVAWPDTQTIGVYRADGSVMRLTWHAVLSGEDVVPGFELPLSRIFLF